MTPAADGGTVVVLGATGWVGRHVVAACAARGRPVLAVARGPAEHMRGHPFHPMDLAAAGPGEVGALLRGADARVVVNAVDAANARDGWDRSEEDLRAANVGAVRTLLEAAADQPRPPRLVHLGTLHEYGPAAPGTAVDERTPPRPANAYARSRLAGSREALAAAREGRADAVVLRLANVCGPHPSPASFPGLLLRLFREAAAGGRPALRVADARRDFVDVRDVAEAVLRAAEVREASGHAVNIGGGRAVPITEAVALMAAVAGLPRGAVAEEPAPVAGLGGDWSLADVRLAGTLLGWRPRTTLEESLRAMWRAQTAPVPGGARPPAPVRPELTHPPRRPG
ncbi:NAD(P)-dependent oxidoreductase [Nocardiopsis sp. RSe5-2]|uniref:NAD(P)-dependent oxidoreductase n=1 Tax=Nocardiopsis endophytica TaxID=3018445 RepID=A0ABT4UA44_9ACTN|nr:NAD(P)-dependent oxidoreductase [Nocardiopsis endophytica]MDA2813260.1 NAD(P)-dependent oxidoreductase [Nocardiopsis endophytica]